MSGRRLRSALPRRRRQLIGAVVVTVSLWPISSVLLSAQASPRQAASAPAVAFEVASIKENKSDVPMVNLNWQPGGRFVATNVSLQALLGIAFSDGAPLPPNRIVVNEAWMGGGASYVSAARFDIAAKAEGDPPREQLPALLRSLLTDRFKLVAHRERRELPVYFLRLDRGDRRPGPRLRISQADCPENGAPRPGTAVPPPPSLNALAPPVCGFRSVPGRASGRAVTIATLARLMTGWLDDHRPVEDQTELAAAYDVDLDWLPNRPLPPDAPPVPAADPDSPPLFTAIREQLGLRLEPGNTAEDLLVVDHAERPTPN